MTVHRKLVFAMISTAVLSMGAYLLVASWQSQRQSESARYQIKHMVESSTVDTSAAIVRLIAAQDEALRKQVESELNVARYFREKAGPVSFSRERVRWNARNQFTRQETWISLPKMLFGGRWLGQDANPSHYMPLIDDEVNLVGGTMTIFQRIDSEGDMMRVATNVNNGKVRALGTYIPHEVRNSAPNPVIQSLIHGKTYRGIAWVVNHYYVTCYEPLFDQSGQVIGAIYTGEREENGAGLRDAIVKAQVGRTGSVVIIAGSGDRRGTCLISRDDRNGKDLTRSKDVNGARYAEKLILTAAKLKEGQTAVVHYTLGTAQHPVPIAARVARYTPWDWVVVTESHENDFKPVYEGLYNSGNAIVVAFVLIGAVMLVLTLPLVWADANERARREAERANTAKSEFLSRMSHELRTPMNAILGFSQLLEMDDLTEDQLESVRQIRTAGHHLLRLINEVLDISKIEAGALTLSLEDVSPYELASEVSSLIQPMAAQRGIALVSEIQSANDSLVIADRQRLLQVLLNLVSNAVKYNRPQGSVRIHCEREGENLLQICVTDTGFGISDDQAENLFIPFERLGAESTSVEGTGLGLTLSKRLMEAMGGAIGFNSTPEGTTFFVTIPCAAQADGAFDATPDAEIEAPREDRSSKTILLVEDNDANTRLIERVVTSRTGHRLIVAMLGQLGYELAIEHKPDIILIDTDLPDWHGSELLEKIRKLSSIAHTPVVVFSDEASHAQMQQMIGAGADRYMTKPLDVKQLLEILQELLGGVDEQAA